MEIWTDIEFKMPTDTDYKIMKLMAENYYDDDDHWPVEEYNSEERTITIETVLATQDDAVEFATDLLEEIISRLANKASGDVRDAILGLSYEMHAHTDEGGYTEVDYIIERNGDKLTMKESDFSHEDFSEDDEDQSDAYEEWSLSPNYGPEIDLKKKRTKSNEVENVNDMIVEYLKANNMPCDNEAISKLSVEDVYAIMAGTFGKEDDQ